MKFYAIWVFILATLLAAGGHASDRQGTGKSEQPGAQAPQADDALITTPDISSAPEDTLIFFLIYPMHPSLMESIRRRRTGSGTAGS